MLKGLGWATVGVLAQLFGEIILDARAAWAQSVIVPDETLGGERSIVEPVNGLPVDVIGGGAIRGANLFHSFQEFNVASGRGAYFFNFDNGIQNILARVTGQNRSEILGTLGIFQLQDITSRPNLFLINPNGILFGPSAYLDVGGSIVATTANAIQVGDRGIFSASVPQLPNPLLAINPSVFLFNTLAKPEIINQARATEPAGGFRWNLPANTSGLQVPDGQSLILLGGNVTLDGGLTTASGGRIELGGLAALGSVGLEMNANNLTLQFPEAVERGDVGLKNGAIASVRTTTSGGNLAITARNVDILEGSPILAGILQGETFSDRQAGDITIDATERVNVSGQSSNSQLSAIDNSVYSDTTGNSGNINIFAKSLTVANRAYVSASTFGNGNSGNVLIRATDSINLSGSSGGLFASVQATGKGRSGNLTVETNLLSVSDGSEIFTGMLGEGDVGQIDIKTGNLIIKDAGRVNSSTYGTGNSGKISITAINAISLDSRGAIASNVSSKAVGNSGGIDITTSSLSISNRAGIYSNTFGQGNGGNITIEAKNFVQVLNDGELESDVQRNASGNSGDITIKTGRLIVKNSK